MYMERAMRGKKAIFNIIATLGLQLANIISGLIVPNLIIKQYGSDVNGLIVSVTQFLNYISLLDGGAGGVIKAALYAPLAQKNNKKVSSVLVAAKQFFHKIALVFCVYIAIFMLIYPRFVESVFSFWYIASLVLIIGSTSVIRYVFGVTYQLLVQADQKAYVYDCIRIFGLLFHVLFTLILVRFHVSIQTIKLFSLIAFTMEPMILVIYVRKCYRILSDADPDKRAISQRWDGFGQHIAYFIHTNTDVVILTIFSTVSEISVYSVYSLIAAGLKNVIYALSNGFSAMLGDMIAKGERAQVRYTFEMLEWVNTLLTFDVFATASVMIMPFVRIYTRGVDDADYLRLGFALLILGAEMVYCLRFPMVVTANAAGHYRQTKKGAFWEAGINILLSVCLVRSMGLLGVAIGTLAGMTYRTIDYIRYMEKNILCRKPWRFVKNFVVNLSGTGCGMLLLRFIPLPKAQGYFTWVCGAVVVFGIFSGVLVVFNLVFSAGEGRMVFKRLMGICTIK